MAQLVTSIAEKLIEVLGHEAITKVFELWGYQSELEELKQTVSTVKMVLLDADAKWDHLSNQDRDFVRKLRDVVYDADDVFDEFHTLAQLNLLHGRPKKRAEILRKVRRFFSSKNQVGEAYRMSCEIKDIKKRLDAIANDHAKFNLGVDVRPISRRPKETCSYVNVSDIIGRDEDKEKILNMLLAPDNNFCILAIVGVGGLGKTALTQLVFGDEKIKQEFPDPTLRLWVCVSDQDGKQFDEKEIMCRILELVTNAKPDSNSSKEFLQRQFQEKMRAKKFLLVLDDVWNENRTKWLDLEEFLRMGHGGSKIVVTTRSEETAAIIGSKHVYKLDGLSSEYSQRLFEMSAFGEVQELGNHKELVEIGKKIVEKCYCIPLALKVVGSLLYGQDIKKWMSIQEGGLAKIGNGNIGVLSILKLSYHNLEPSLKSCFSYCAIFPKDFEIEKEKIIGLWLAQGYVVPSERGQDLEDAADDHFTILLRRCFFQDVNIDEYGDVQSVKIHDLMHDVAQEVGEEEIFIPTSTIDNIGDKVRHVYIGDGSQKNSIGNKKIRSYFCESGRFCDAEIYSCMCLMVLVLSDCSIKSLPDSIRKLIHLRYLDLSWNHKIEVLCESLTELYNLQFLDLSGCYMLRELPNGLGKLVNLRHLNLMKCDSLISMPSGMDKLTNLKFLPLFVVGTTNEKQRGEGMLKDLKALNKIQGNMCVKIGRYYRNVEDTNGNMGGGYVKSMKYLRELEIEFVDRDDDIDIEAIMDKLEPPPNLKKLHLDGYEGKRIGRWGRAQDNLAISSPLLVKIVISMCMNLEGLPVLSTLPHLKSLTLTYLASIEYMENGMSSQTEATITQFFSSLESLEINNLLKLSIVFPRLSYLCISFCPNLSLNFICPSLRSLELGYNTEKLQITHGNLQDDVVKGRTFAVNRVGHIKSVPTNCMTKLDKEKEKKVESLLQEKAFQSFLHTLTIEGSIEREEEEEEEEEEEAWKALSRSLQILKFSGLKRMKSLPKGMQHLTSLESLRITYCKNIKGLPEWISCLSSLQSLDIDSCPSIKSLPESIKDLTSLKTLDIVSCPDLEERCREPNGEDFHKIQHIPEIYIRKY